MMLIPKFFILKGHERKKMLILVTLHVGNNAGLPRSLED